MSNIWDLMWPLTKEHGKIWTKDKDESELEGGGEVISEPEDPTVKCQLSLTQQQWKRAQLAFALQREHGLK